MSLHCFSILALHPEPAQSALNLFLATERVVAVRREFINDGANSTWAFWIELAVGTGCSVRSKNLGPCDVASR